MKREVIASAIGLFLIVAQPAEAAHDQGPCVTGQRLGPGPIVNGRHRQPTQHEVELRVQRLKELSSGACFVNAATALPPHEILAGAR
jgi:hypothetical protein